MAQFSGQTWTYRNDNLGEGQLTPVASYVKSQDDPTPADPQTAGHVWTGYAEIEGWDEIPDDNYHGGIRREMRVRGPVVNRNRNVVIDSAPVYVRAEN